MPAEWIAIGKIMRAVGLDGKCGIEAFGKSFAALVPPCVVRIGRKNDDGRDAVIEMIDEQPGGYQCRFKDVADRSAAELLRGMMILVDRQSLPARATNEYYYYELKEMQVFDDRDGALLGRVAEVQAMPSMDTIEVALVKGGSVILPFSAQAIERIDTDAKRVVIRGSFLQELLE
jgi:16S rRNA processing protein RimM